MYILILKATTKIYSFYKRRKIINQFIQQKKEEQKKLGSI